MSAWVWVVGAGAAAFFVCFLSGHIFCMGRKLMMLLQGRAAIVALRRSGGGAGPLGRSFYKGGFEPKMTRKEAALILEMPCVCHKEYQAIHHPLTNRNKGTRHHERTPP